MKLISFKYNDSKKLLKSTPIAEHYDTVITDDVLGHLTTDEVNKQLQAIKEL